MHGQQIPKFYFTVHTSLLCDVTPVSHSFSFSFVVFPYCLDPPRSVKSFFAPNENIRLGSSRDQDGKSNVWAVEPKMRVEVRRDDIYVQPGW